LLLENARQHHVQSTTKLDNRRKKMAALEGGAGVGFVLLTSAMKN